jgi:hypothetical protein
VLYSTKFFLNAFATVTQTTTHLSTNLHRLAKHIAGQVIGMRFLKKNERTLLISMTISFGDATAATFKAL